jgi:hypothetical protein
VIATGCRRGGSRCRRGGHRPLLRLSHGSTCGRGSPAGGRGGRRDSCWRGSHGRRRRRRRTRRGRRRGNAWELPARSGPGPHRTRGNHGPWCARRRRDRRPGHGGPRHVDDLACRFAHHETLTWARLVGPRGGFRFRPEDGAVTEVGTRRLRRGRRRHGTGPLAGRRARRALGHAGPSGSRGRGGRRGRLLGLDSTSQPFTVGLAPGAVGLCVFDRRRVTLHTDPEVDANVQGFLVGQP